MKLLVFQHIDCEHPGSFRGMLNRAGIEWDVVALDEGGTIPDLAGYDALWVMGGPMDVWDEDKFAWLIEEKEAIRTWVQDMGKPFMGLCLGHQLLAASLGGECNWLKPPEIGILEIELTPQGRAEPLFDGWPDRQKVLQWHSVEVTRPPIGAVILARSERSAVQAMRVGNNAWSMQYHVELEPDTVTSWAAVPSYHEALLRSVGVDGFEDMKEQAASHMDGFTASAETLFRNFFNHVRNG